MLEERRKNKRVKADFAIAVDDLDGSSISEAMNVSLNGLAFQTGKKIALMKRVAITLILPVQTKSKKNFAKLSCFGVVVRSVCSKEKPRSYEISVYFVDMTKQERKVLEKYIKYVVSKSD